MGSRLCPYCMKSTEGDTCPHCGKKGNYTAQSMHLPAGYVLSGNHPYVLGAVLGQGGFGITYIALDMTTGQRVAIKEYYPTYCAFRSNIVTVSAYSGQLEVYEKGRDRFLEEARTLQRLSDLESIVNVLDFFETNMTAYLVMEFLEGCSLKESVTKHGPFPARSFLKQLKPLLEDLYMMHERGVIHRDIAPDNIILLPDGQLKLIDFGAARSYLGDKSMTVMVKKGFTPLEQHLSKGCSTASDVYSLASTVYYCITGTVPIDSTERYAQAGTLISPSQLGAAVTPNQEAALIHAMEVQAKDRTQDLLEFHNQLYAISDNPGKKVAFLAVVLAAVLAVVLLLFPVIQNSLEDVAVSREFAPTSGISAVEEEGLQEPWEKNVLMKLERASDYWTDAETKPFLRGPITRGQVASVTFLDSLDTASQDAWDVSQAQDGSVMAWAVESGELYEVYIGAEGGINAKYCYKLFSNCKNLSNITFNDSFHTDYTDCMCHMFSYTSLTSLDLSNFVTSSVTDMTGMFWSSPFTSLDLSSFDTSLVTDMSYMFSSTESLRELDISSFDTSSVTNMYGMFDGNTSLISLDLSHFDTSNVTDMSAMFRNTENLQQLDISGFDTSSVSDMSHMFFDCGVKALDLSSFDTSLVTDMGGMFESTKSLTMLDLSSFDTSSVTDMSNMFCYSGVTALDLSHFDTANVTSMEDMFGGTDSLAELDISGFDTSAVTNMRNMFFRTALTSLDLSHFDTSAVVTMSSMFQATHSLKQLDISSFDTGNVTDMSYMFFGSSIQQLDVSGFNTSNVRNMHSMFNGCKSLNKILGIENWNTSNVTDYEDFMDKGKSIDGKPWEKLFEK